MKVVKEPNIDVKVNVSTILASEPYWMDPIIEFLAENRLLSEGKEAEKVHGSQFNILLFYFDL